MFPIIFQIGPIAIYSYGFMLAVAVIVCSFLAGRDAERMGIGKDFIYDFGFWVVISGLIGARIYFILLSPRYFIENPIEILMINKGGLAWQGGLILGSIAGLFYVNKKNVNLPKFLDLFAPYIALGQAIGRVGCFLNGCCYGREDVHGIFFPAHDAYLIPVQLYSAFILFIIYLVLVIYRNRTIYSGTTIGVYLMLASAERFIVQFYRADYEPIAFNIGIFQMFCIFFFILGAYAFLYFKSKSRQQ